ncbi:MFS transporter, partial [Candidatus Omnitrophota bacterium]
LQIVFCITLMAVVGVSSIVPAFPRIVEELHISKTDIGMLITAFALPSAILAPFIGVLGDKFGRKRILVPSLFLFGLAGGSCALSKDFNVLITLRMIQGVGASALGALSLTVLGDLFSGRQRAEAMGLNAGVLSIGIASYPLIGGALATFSWNIPFLLPLAAIPVGVIVLRWLNSPEPRSSQGLGEYLGSVWKYLRNLRIASAFAAGIIVFIILFGPYLTYLALFLGTTFDASPFIIGCIYSCMPIVTAMVSPQLGRLVRFVSLSNLVKIGFVIFALSLALLPFTPKLWFVLIPVSIFGVAHGIGPPGLQTYVAGLAPDEYRAAFMALTTTMFRLGQTLGPLICGIVYAYAGFDGVFFFGAGLSLIAAIVGFAGRKLIH